MSCKDCCIPGTRSGFFRRLSSRRKNRKIVLMLVGLDNAGKSCTAKRLAGESVETVVPTVGFSSIKLKHRGFTVIIYDLGGSSQIRGIWHRYFVDVHGVIFVVDASDLSRIDESRKVLHELLAHENLTGKPLLLLANKQDCAGALDEIDIVERLEVEELVNRQKCPTLVETCSTTGAPSGRKPQIDPGILSGYRWLLRRIISEYDRLNARVERDVEEQRVANEAARQEWLRRQDTDHQVESLPSDGEETTQDPFKPLDKLVHSNKQVEQNGHVKAVGEETANVKVAKEVVANGHAVVVEGPNGHDGDVDCVKPLTPTPAHSLLDSPDSSSRAVEGEGEGERVKAPKQSPTKIIPRPAPPSPPTDPDTLVISEPQPIDIVMAVKEQLEWKMKEQKRKKRRLQLRRSNRTAPSSANSEPEGRRKELPPLKLECHWMRPATAKSLPSQGWGLTMSLEEVMPPELPPKLSALSATEVFPPGRRTSSTAVTDPSLEVLASPKQLITSDTDSDSDNDDVVVICSLRS